MALLVWMVAALALMAGTMALLARTDMQLAQMQSRTAQVVALGDGMARIMVRDLLELQRRGEYVAGMALTRAYHFAGQDVMVRVQPAVGLIDINAANEGLWLDLLHHGAGLSEADALALVEQITIWRMPPVVEPDAPPVRGGQFQVVEDLLLVPGMTREILELIRPSIHAFYTGAPVGINLLSAPASVLQVLSRGDQELVGRFVADRREDPMAHIHGYPGMTPDYLGQGGNTILRIDVRVAQPDGRAMLYRRWVDTVSQGRDGLPWRFLRSESPIRVNGIEFDD